MKSKFKITRLADIKPDLRCREICNLEAICEAIEDSEKLQNCIRSNMLAYGCWTLDDGRAILFNGQPHYDNIAHEEWFYDDGESEADKRRKSIAGMKQLGLIE